MKKLSIGTIAVGALILLVSAAHAREVFKGRVDDMRIRVPKGLTGVGVPGITGIKRFLPSCPPSVQYDGRSVQPIVTPSLAAAGWEAAPGSGAPALKAGTYSYYGQGGGGDGYLYCVYSSIPYQGGLRHKN